MKVVEASGGDIEKAKLLAAGKKLAEQGAENAQSAEKGLTAAGAKAAEPEYRVVDSPWGDGSKVHVYPVKARTSDGKLVIMQLGFEPGQRPSGKIEAAGGTEDRPMKWDEIQEIEAATGRPYQEGDTIYGRAQPA